MTLTSVQQSAYDSIQSHLSDHWYSGVNEDDLNSVRQTLADLGATDADAVIDAMADSGLLTKLAEESNQGEFLGMGQDGFSAGERQDLFNDLAGKLDGQSLAAVSKAFAGAEEKHDDFNVVTELGQAVADRASPQAKLDYIAALAPDTGGEGIRDTYWGGGSGTTYVDSEAGAIGTVLGSLSGSYADAAFRSLTDDQLAAVLQTGVEQFQTNSGATFSSSFDTGRFEGVVRAAATIGDPALKARVFDLAGDRLGAVSDAGDGPTVFADNEGALKGMTDAMYALLDSDTSGIMRQLTFNGATAGGDAMTHYAEAMIATGQTERLADTMTDLQFGNAHDENAVERLDQIFTTPGGQQIRENAGALGYFLGSVYAGAADHSSDVKAQQEAISGFLDFVIGKIPLAKGVSAGDLTLGQDVIKQAVQMAIDDPGLSPAQRLELAAMPRDANGRQIAGDDITNTFRTTLEAVRRAQEE